MESTPSEVTVTVARVGSVPALDAVSSRRASLRSAMNVVEGAIAAPATGRIEPWRGSVITALTQLSVQFEDHVATTEGPDGFHDDLVREAPRLAHAVRALAIDHGECGQALQAALRATEEASDEPAVERARDVVTGLLGRLSKHRQRGAELIYEAYQFDLGTGD